MDRGIAYLAAGICAGALIGATSIVWWRTSHEPPLAVVHADKVTAVRSELELNAERVEHATERASAGAQEAAKQAQDAADILRKPGITTNASAAAQADQRANSARQAANNALVAAGRVRASFRNQDLVLRDPTARSQATEATEEAAHAAQRAAVEAGAAAAIWRPASTKELWQDETHWNAARSAARMSQVAAEDARQAAVSVKAGSTVPQAESTGPYALVTVYFGTDRNKAAETSPEGVFGSGRSEAIRYGTCVVSIPMHHAIGELERPSMWRLEFREDPEKHIVLHAVVEQSPESFRETLIGALSDASQRSALLFVHGYNTSFADAARRTGQLAYDLDFRGSGTRGVAVFYSWPSKGQAILYPADENAADWTLTGLSTFLVELLSQSRVENLYLVAHSMGSRPALRAVAALWKTQPQLAKRIKEVILAAPDIDADVFRRQIASVFGPGRLSGTLYVSSIDVALKTSEQVNGGYPRLGDPKAGPVIVDGIETVDATLVDDGDFLGHGYYSGAVVLHDIGDLVLNGIRAARRFGMTPVDMPAGRYWQIKRTAR